MIILECGISSKYIGTINTIEWILVEQQGVNKKSGKQNAQLELVLTNHTIQDVIEKLIQ